MSLFAIATLFSLVLVAGLVTGTIITPPAASGLVRRAEKPAQFLAAVITYAAIIFACVIWAAFRTFG